MKIDNEYLFYYSKFLPQFSHFMPIYHGPVNARSRPFPAGLKNLARGLLGLALLGPLQRTLIGPALTWGNPPGQRMRVVNLGWHDYLGLRTAAVLLAVATVMGEASRLAAENDSFI